MVEIQPMVGAMRLLDLFCGAGGAARGYADAGVSEIVGVDNKLQKSYPYEFVQADALEYLATHGGEYDAIHASPPCQGYSIMQNLPWLRGRDYPLLILPVLEMLDGLGKPYVLENVMGAQHGSQMLEKRGLLAHGLQGGWLCGAMFGLPFYRHRLFSCNWFWLAPGHPKHKTKVTEKRRAISEQNIANPVNSVWREMHDGGRPRNGAQVAGCGVGHSKGWKMAAEAMGIDWMNRKELTQAIPPAYTEFVGGALLRQYFGR